MLPHAIRCDILRSRPAERTGFTCPGFRHLLAEQRFASNALPGRDLRPPGQHRSLPVVAGCGGGRPGQILAKLPQRNKQRYQGRRQVPPFDFYLVGPPLQRPRRSHRRGPRRGRELDAEREKLEADGNREIDELYAAMQDQLPRGKRSVFGIAYARYSTEFQHSVADQIRGIFDFAVKSRIFIPRGNIFFDLATRGCKERRAGLDQVRDILHRKAAQALLVFATNRLFRKNYKCMKFVEEEGSNGACAASS
jgi:hypothetical protein